MSTTTPLCQLPVPAPSACGCGASSTVPLVVVPLPIDNPPGLSSITYRIGTFTSFRQAMLDSVADPELLGTAPNPFISWQPGTNNDYQTRFIELWAYLGDILTFYQERVANEAYIGTATQLDSVIRLSQLIAYQSSPGSGASGVAAFSAAAGKTISLPANFRIGSRAQGSQPAAVFEISDGVTVRSEHNAIALASVYPTNQFALLSSFHAVFDGSENLTTLTAAAGDIFSTAGETLLKAFPRATFASHTTVVQEFKTTATPAAQPAIAEEKAVAKQNATVAKAGKIGGPIDAIQVGVTGASTNFALDPGRLSVSQFLGGISYQIPRYINKSTRSIVLAGVSLRLTVGDYVLTVDSSISPAVFVYQLDSVTVDKTANTTTVTWSESAGTTYTAPVSLYAMRVKAAPFGGNAPPWISLSPALNNNDPTSSPPSWGTPTYSSQVPWPTPSPSTMPTPYPNYDDPMVGEGFLPFLGDSSSIYLDGVYDSVRATQQSPGHVVLLPQGQLSSAKSFPFISASAVTAVGYSFSTKVTRITLASGSTIPSFTYGIRNTVILAGADLLPLKNDLPLPDLLTGNSIILGGLYPNLQNGQPVVLQGNLYVTPNSPSAEYHTLQGQPLLDSVNDLTTVTIDSPLGNQYSRASSVLLANVAAFTQGETVKDEILGSGNATAYQTFALAKKPLTYLPSTDPQSTSPVQSTLTVIVNGVAWQEETDLLQSSPDAQQFTIANNATQQSSVVFGDGTHGAPPPVGVQNIHARYRVGLGTSGNLPAASVAQLIDSSPGLSQVANPLPTVGGADPDTVADTRINAPASVRAFNRAVSEADYAALALTFPGVAKATAAVVSVDSNGNALAQPYIQLTIATSGSSPVDQPTHILALAPKLRQFLDQRRDPNIPLRIVRFMSVYVDVYLTVDILSTYGRQATISAVQAALNSTANPDGSYGYFSFQQLNFGQSLYLSAVYALVQRIPGVSDLTITRFQPTNLVANAPTVTPSDILVGQTQIAAINNDPANAQYGQLIITPGIGGFADL